MVTVNPTRNRWIFGVALVLLATLGLSNCAGVATEASHNQQPFAPSITSQPANQTVTVGQPATFMVAATGTAPLNYQWRRNGSPINGANSSAYTLASTSMSDNGATFDVVVSNSVGNATSSAATLTVNPAPVPPSITTQPTGQTVTAGLTATFSVSASGTAPLSYQWQKKVSGTFTNISGANSSSYTTPATTVADNGAIFDVIVSNSVGNATSSAVTLTVNPALVPPSITTQPVNQTVTAGGMATFLVGASGTAPLNYQWQKQVGGVFANIAGATSSSYTTPATTLADNGSVFDVMVSNSAGNATSNPVTLTVNPPPTPPGITTQPINQTVTAGQMATFAVVASGTAPLNYQWQKQIGGVFTNIAGAISSSYTTPVTTVADSGTVFDVVVSNTAGNATSNAVTLTVNPAPVPPSITTQPTNQSVTTGQMATFSVVASGTAPLNYQWQKQVSGVFTNIAGATFSSYTTPATTVADSGSVFDVVVSNTAGNATSSPVTLTVTPAPVPPSITTQPVNQTVTAGQMATFSSVASGTAPLNYQWQKQVGGVFNNIAGATSSSYTTPATTVADSGSVFNVVVSNSVGNVTSQTATLTVNPAPVPPSITTQPTNQTVTAGQMATFTVAASGSSPLSYQWQKRVSGVFTNIAAATSASYTTPVTTVADSGTVFDVVVSNSAGNATSNAVTLTVNPAPVPPSITTQPTNQTVTAGQMATFSVVASGTAPLNYQWQKQVSGVFTNIAGAISASYTTPATTVADSGTVFDVVVSNTVGSATSQAVTLTVNPAPIPPSITTQPTNQTVTVGGIATFSVVASGTAPLSYQWRKQVSGSFTNITNATSSSYTTPATTLADNGTVFDVVVSNSAGNATSNAVTLTVNAVPPSITTQPTNQTVTAGQMATFTVAASGTAPLNYQWQKQVSGVFTNISGATSFSYTTPVTTVTDSGTLFDAIVSNSAGNATSNAVTLTVNPPGSGTDVVTYHYDNARTGANLTETTLVPSNVVPASFGLKKILTLDDRVDAQPLYLSGLTIAGGLHNVVYVATEHDTVYAYDADTFALLWKTSVLQTGESPSDDRGCNQVTPNIGVTATPVIDRAAGIIYVVAMSKNSSGSYFQRIHALDITTGAELLGGPKTVQATYPGSGPNSSGGNLVFSAKQYKDRAALLLLNGVVYTSWASHCDVNPYNGWIMGYRASDLTQVSVLNLTPNGTEGSIWQSGGGLAADSQGNIYALMANGTFETTLDANGFPKNQDYGNAFVKISPVSGAPTPQQALKVVDYFNMHDTVSESNADADLGSGGPMVLPDLVDISGKTRHLAVGAGKDSRIYVVDRDNMGKFNSSSDSNIYQELSGVLPNGVWGVPAYFNNIVFYCDQINNMKAFAVSNAKLSGTPTKTVATFSYPGALPSVSANGSSNGIVWTINNTAPANLRAYTANNLANEIYSSDQAANNRDHFGDGNKYITPVVADGHVFVGTTTGFAIFGPLP